jgi:hypothetical protein
LINEVMNRLLRNARGTVVEPEGSATAIGHTALAESEIRQVVEHAAEVAGMADPVAVARLVDLGALAFEEHGMPTR